jgi:hypothetical protein
MSIFENKAGTIVSQAVQDKVPVTVAIDPLTIIAIIELMLEIIMLWKKCKNEPADALDMVRSPGIIRRMQLRALVNKKIRNSQIGLYNRQLQSAMLVVGQDLNLSEIIEMYAEAENNEEAIFGAYSSFRTK